MKKEKPIIRYFRNCKIKFVTSQRHVDEFGKVSYSFQSFVKEQVYLKTKSDTKSIQYFDFTDGIKARWVTKRSKSFKILESGEEVTIEQFQKDIIDYNFLIKEPIIKII